MQPAGANAQQQLPESPALRAGQALPVTGQPMARYINVANIGTYRLWFGPIKNIYFKQPYRVFDFVISATFPD